jgi:tetratricopeptide (TPR) repeat protein
MQCHLLTASTRLPSLVRKFGRAPFSYVAGQPLTDFVLSFDHAPGKGFDDKFEIAGGAYRFRQSQCFLRSKGGLTCETCHNPHDIPRGAEAIVYYARICRQCHAGMVDRLTAAGSHPSNPDCVRCHMPKRRTDDAVHVVMTDHLIQRRAQDRDLLAELPEKHPDPRDEYHGQVIPYYPPQPGSASASAPDDTVYLALAQVRDGRNLESGIEQLSRALAHASSPRPEFYMGLGDAWHTAGDPAKAAAAYRQAVKLRPDWAPASRYLGIALHESGQAASATTALKRAIELDPSEARAWLELALIASETGRSAEAVADIQKAAALDPDLPDVWNALGTVANSEDAFRRALRIDPYYAAANGNLARLLAAGGELAQAVYYFDKAARLQPSGAVNLYEYALTLVQLNRFEDSQREAQAAVRADPNLAEAHELLGGLLARNKDLDAALVEYREAVRLKPEFSRAQLDLAAMLAAKGNTSEAILHFREAARSADPQIANAAAQALRRIGGNP